MAKNHKILAPFQPPSPFLSRHLSPASPDPLRGPAIDSLVGTAGGNSAEIGRNTNHSHLHPAFRESLEALLLRFQEEQIPFFLYEGFRSQARQAYLHSQNRTQFRKGFSLHQYGLAADLALEIKGKVTWDRTPEFSNYWEALEIMAPQYSLLLMEEEGDRGPGHVECTFTDIGDVTRGLLPSPGENGKEWWENLTA